MRLLHYAGFRIVTRNGSYLRTGRLSSNGCMGNTTNSTRSSRLSGADHESANATLDPARDLPDVMKAYGATVKAAARKVLGPCADVEDVVQETWMTFLAHGHKVNDPRCLGSWLYRVATNASFRVGRKRSRYTLSSDETLFERLPADTRDAALSLHGTEQKAAILRALDDLSEADRQLAELLLDPRDLPYKEISMRCGRPMGSLGPTRERLIRKLRNAPAVQRLLDSPTDDAGGHGAAAPAGLALAG
jgi:RNA polymerase sigma factor (sigma-70 family)